MTAGTQDPDAVTGGWSAPEPDDPPNAALLRGLIEGDPAAIQVLLARHHAAVELLADAAAAPPGPGDTVRGAWQALRASVAGGPVSGDPRADLLGLVIDILAEADLLDRSPTAPLPVPGPFLPEGDAWAGWWAEEGPVAWPDGIIPAPDAVLRALRRLPLEPRVLLVLRDAAGLTPESVAGILGQAPEWQTVTLHQARDAFVAHLDREATHPDPGSDHGR